MPSSCDWYSTSDEMTTRTTTFVDEPDLSQPTASADDNDGKTSSCCCSITSSPPSTPKISNAGKLICTALVDCKMDDNIDSNNHDNSSITFDSDTDSSNNNTITCPLFMENLPNDFTSNVGLAALASLLNNDNYENLPDSTETIPADDDDDDEEEDNDEYDDDTTIREATAIVDDTDNQSTIDTNDSYDPNDDRNSQTTIVTPTNVVMGENSRNVSCNLRHHLNHNAGKNSLRRQQRLACQRQNRRRSANPYSKPIKTGTTTSTTVGEAQLFLKLWKL